MPENNRDQPTGIVLEYGTNALDQVPDWNPQAEALISAGRSPNALRRIFGKAEFAAKYYAKSLARRHALSEIGTSCISCGCDAPVHAVRVGWWVRVEPRWFERWGGISNLNAKESVTTHTVHAICLPCYKRWRNQSRDQIRTIIGIGAAAAALVLVWAAVLVLSNLHKPLKIAVSFGMAIAWLVIIALVTGTLVEKLPFGQLPRLLRKTIHRDVLHNGDLELCRPAGDQRENDQKPMGVNQQ